MPYHNSGPGPVPGEDDHPLDPVVVRRMESVARVLAYAVAGLGALVLVSWWFGIEGIQSFGSGLATMKANAAAAFLCVGLGLGVSNRPHVSRTLGAVAALIGGVSVLQHVTGFGFGIDQLLATDTSERHGLMSPATAAGALSGGLGVVLRDVPFFGSRFYWSEWFGRGCGVLGLLGGLGYAYDVPTLYSMGLFSSMSLPTTLSLLAIAMSMLAGRPHQGVSSLFAADDSGGRLARRMLPAVLFVPALFGWLRVWSERAYHVPAPFGVAMVITSTILVIGAMLWWTASSLRNADAEKRAAEASVKRTEAQLLQAQKMDAVARLAGGIAHDFNNLLSVILSYSQMIIADLPDDDEVRADVEEIERAATRAEALTRQLLMFSRQEVFEPKDVDLNLIVSDMKKMLSRLIGENIQLETVCAEDLGLVRADAGGLEQALMNLIVNARDAMPDGGRILVETANVELDSTYAEEHHAVVPGPYVMVAITDEGGGMDAATQQHIFDPFFTTKPKGKGTGLGLSTTFGVIKQNGGTIWLYSEVGAGTTFKIYLPRVESSGPARQTVVEPTRSLLGTETILLVEDEAQVRAVASRILTECGYEVLVAADGVEAQRIADDYVGLIDLLITDVVMPGANGPQVAKRVQAKRPDTKVMFISGYTDEAAIRNGLVETGAVFLQKPLTPTGLARRVREVLDQ